VNRQTELRVETARGLPQLIATDLDGTLVGAGMVISQRSGLALRRAAAAGAVIVLVTGRSLRGLPRVYAELGARYPAICANGAVVYEPTDDLVRAYRPMEPASVSEVCQRLRRRVPDVTFAAEVDCGRRRLHEPGWPVAEDSQVPAFPVGLVDLTATQVVMLQARAPGRDSGSFNELVTDTVGDLVEATRPGDGGLVEMTRRGVTKGSALATFAAELGIPFAEVLAFGDMPNDASMLRWAGRSVAVANAHREALAAARDTTLSNVDDGVAAYLEQLLACLP
jgi:hydroxymethylpyrimidine pyrophosphatase-like HAD family hydrolase